MNEIMEVLSPILGDELAKAIIDHRKAKKAKLTVYAAKLQVKEYIKTGDPIAAAEMQLLHGWQAIKADWYFSQLAKDKKTSEAVRPAFFAAPSRHQSREEYLAAERRRSERSFQ